MVSVLLRWTEGKCHPFPGNRDDDIVRKHFTAKTKPHSSRQISPTRHLLLCRLECGETQNPNRQWWTWRGSNPRPHDCQSCALPTAPQAHVLCNYFGFNITPLYFLR